MTMSDQPEPLTDPPTEQEVAEFIESVREPHSDLNKGQGSVLYAWQMQVENGWNIVAMTMPNGITLPLVMNSMALAWEAFEVAQAHATLGACRVRLAMFNYHSDAAVVDPND